MGNIISVSLTSPLYESSIEYLISQPEVKYTTLVGILYILSILAAIFITKGLLVNIYLGEIRKKEEKAPDEADSDLLNDLREELKETKDALRESLEQNETIKTIMPELSNEEEKEKFIKSMKTILSGSDPFKKSLDTDSEEDDLIPSIQNLKHYKDEVTTLKNTIYELEQKIVELETSKSMLSEEVEVAAKQSNESMFEMIAEISKEDSTFKDFINEDSIDFEALQKKINELTLKANEAIELSKENEELKFELKKLKSSEGAQTEDYSDEANKLYAALKNMLAENEELKRLLASEDTDIEALKREMKAFLEAQKENQLLKLENNELKNELELLRKDGGATGDDSGDDTYKLSKALKGLSEENEELKRLLASEDTDIEVLKREIAEFLNAKSENEELKRKNEELSNDLEILQGENSKLISDAEALKAGALEQMDVSQKLHHTLQELLGENDELKRLLSSEDADVETLRKEINNFINASKENVKLKQDLEEISNELQKVKNDNLEMLNETSKLQQETNNQIEINNKLTKTLKELSDENDELKRRVASEDTDIVKLSGELAEFEEARRKSTTLTQENEEMKHELQKSKKEQASMLNEFNSLQKEASDAVNKNQDLLKELSKLKDERDELSRTIASKDADLSTVTKEYEDLFKLKTENDELKRTINDLKTNAQGSPLSSSPSTAIQKELDKSKEEILKLQKEIKEHESSFAAMSQEVNNLMSFQQKNKELKNQLAEKDSSISFLNSHINKLEKTLKEKGDEKDTSENRKKKLFETMEENKNLRQKVTELESTNLEILEEANNFSTQMTSLNKKLEGKQKELDEVTDKLKKNEMELEVMLQEVDNFAKVEQENRDLKQEVAKLKGSAQKAA